LHVFARNVLACVVIATLSLPAGVAVAEELQFSMPVSGYRQAPLPPGSEDQAMAFSSGEEFRTVVEPGGAGLPAQSVSAFVGEGEGESGPGEAVGCSPEQKKKLAQAAAGAYQGLFYDNKFQYLCDPCYDGCLLGEALKRNGLGSCWTFDVGGQYRLRHHSERNMRGLGLTGRDDDFLLHRLRLYGNAEYGQRLRFYAEMLDAHSQYESFNPRPIEEDRVDMLNAFADIKAYEGCRGDLWLRVGRQELLYGAQRTVSPLDWANTRRTFEGYKAFWKGTNWDVDAFYVRPAATTTDRFNSPDQSQEFMGVYSSYKACKDQKADLYFLRLNETDGTPLNFNTLGARWYAESGPWLGELEGAVQFGDFGAANHEAGAFTTGLGRKFPCAKWTPTLWIYYDWASGDPVAGNGYHHLFPLGHKYLGFMDLFGRRNIQDLNLLLTAQPHKKVKLLAWWHMFWLQQTGDVPYSVVMTPEAATAGGSNRLGQELDLTASYGIGPRTNLLLGYSHFFSGRFYDTNPSNLPYSGDADFFYTQFTMNF
jgi:hypothetical protein